jgi:hypothetical protein
MNRPVRLLLPLLLFGAALAACPEPEPELLPALDPEVLDAFSAVDLKETIDFLAADELGGRIPGSPGHLRARDWIADRMEQIGLQPLGTDGYLYAYDTSAVSSRFMIDEAGAVVPSVNDVGYDVVGLIPGSDPEREDEYIVLMAHYDHLGVDEDGNVFNGAFDDAGGTAVALEIARVLLEHDAAPPRSIVIVITDDEENGLRGAEAWIDAPTVPASDIVAAISADPLGRPMLPDYWPIIAIGLERAPTLEALWREAARQFQELPVLFMNRDAVPVFGSDQDAFYAAPEPLAAVWFVNPGFSWYHTIGDLPETIDYRVLLPTTRWLASVLNVMGHDTQRYPYEGPRPLDAQTAADGVTLFDGILSSDVLTTDEILQASAYRRTMAEGVEADSLEDVVDNVDLFLFNAVFFVMFDITEAHPGAVPPPFPQ